MDRRTLRDGETPFDVSVWPARSPRCTVLFAVGGGGDPARHAGTLARLAEAGGSVVAPHFARLGSPRPSREELLLRARRLRAAVDVFADPGIPLVGVGHSIGGTMLLVLGGARAWVAAGSPLEVEREPRLRRVVAMAPPVGFFGSEERLEGLRTPTLVLAGSADRLTPASQVLGLIDEGHPFCEVVVLPDAGHFSFMDVPPPGTEERTEEHETFLESLTTRLIGVVSG